VAVAVAILVELPVQVVLVTHHQPHLVKEMQVVVGV
jgi:hypothetical protein